MRTLLLLVTLMFLGAVSCDDHGAAKVRAPKVLNSRIPEKENRARHGDIIKRRSVQHDQNGVQAKEHSAGDVNNINSNVHDPIKVNAPKVDVSQLSNADSIDEANRPSIAKDEVEHGSVKEDIVQRPAADLEPESDVKLQSADQVYIDGHREAESKSIPKQEEHVIPEGMKQVNGEPAERGGKLGVETRLPHLPSDTRVDDLIAAFKMSESDVNLLRQADFANGPPNGNPFIAQPGDGRAEQRNGRVPTFVDAGDGTFRIVGGPEPDSGTMSVVLIFCFVALLIIAVIFAQQRAAVSAPHVLLDGYAKKNGGPPRSKSGSRPNQKSSKNRSSPVGANRYDSNSFEVNLEDESGYFATRKRVQTDLEGLRDIEGDIEPRCAAPEDYLPDFGNRSDHEQIPDDDDDESGSDYGKLNEDTAALAGFSEDESVSDDVPFDYRTVEDEVDDLDGGDSDGDSVMFGASSGAQHDNEAQAEGDEADWSLDDSDSESDSKKQKSRWSFW